MVLNPNANWTAAIDDPSSSPVYYLAIDGLTSKHYSTAPVRSAGTTKTVLLNIPKGTGGSVDLVDGRLTIGQVRVELLDVDGEITDLVACNASGAPLASLKNRKVTLYAGYRHLVETDYAAVGTYRITDLRMNRGATGYELTLSDPLFLLDGEIMAGATETTPAMIRGNVVNMAVSIMRGVFSTSDPDFPLDYVSTAGASSSAPTGLGIADALLDFTQIKAERDTWRVNDVGQCEYLEPETGLSRAWKRIQSDSAHAQESRFEKEKLDFHRRVRDGYLDLARLEPERFAVIDADADADIVQGRIEAVLVDHFKPDT